MGRGFVQPMNMINSNARPQNNTIKEPTQTHQQNGEHNHSKSQKKGTHPLSVLEIG